MWHVQNDPPAISKADVAKNPAAESVYSLFSMVDARWKCAGIESLATRARLEAYRTAEAQDCGADLLQLGRWKLNLWDQGDRNQFDLRMAEAFEQMKQ